MNLSSLKGKNEEHGTDPDFDDIFSRTKMTIQKGFHDLVIFIAATFKIG